MATEQTIQPTMCPHCCMPFDVLVDAPAPAPLAGVKFRPVAVTPRAAPKPKAKKKKKAKK